MADGKQRIGDPLAEAAQSGVLGGRRPIGVRQDPPASLPPVPSVSPPAPAPAPVSRPASTSEKKEKRNRERLTVYLPPDLAEWVRVRAARQRKEISEIIEDTINLYRERTE